MNVYEQCPVISGERFQLRQTVMEDWEDLLAVYSDPLSVPIFNSDNCTGDFYITAEEDMRRMIEFWLMEYGMGYYVRWSIIDRGNGRAVGTIELFNRKAGDFFNNVGLLRLDLRSDYENEDSITALMSTLLPHVEEMFSCNTVATKIPPCAAARRRAMESLGFVATPEKVMGHDGRAYGDYYLCTL